MFFHVATTGTLTPLPDRGSDAPAWGVSGTDTLTPAVLHWLGYDIRHNHLETHEQLRSMLWGSGATELSQPLAAITAALDANKRDDPANGDPDLRH